MEITTSYLQSLEDEELAVTIKGMGLQIEHLENLLCFHKNQRVNQAQEALSEESIARNAYTPKDIDSYASLWSNILIVSQMGDRDILRALRAMCTNCTIEEACCGLHRGQ